MICVFIFADRAISLEEVKNAALNLLSKPAAVEVGARPNLSVITLKLSPGLVFVNCISY